MLYIFNLYNYKFLEFKKIFNDNTIINNINGYIFIEIYISRYISKRLLKNYLCIIAKVDLLSM